MNDPWKLAVRAELERRGMSQAELARAVGSSDPSISLLLRTADECAGSDRNPVQASRFAVKISALLGLPLPGVQLEPEMAGFFQMLTALRAFDPFYPHRLAEQMRKELRRISSQLGKKETTELQVAADMVTREEGRHGDTTGAPDDDQATRRARRTRRKR